VRIERVAVEGWMPFFDGVGLDVPAGPIAVVGVRDGDERKSNRSGKTSLLEAVRWCLFGAHRKRLEDSIIHVDAKSVRVRVSVGDLVVERSRARGGPTRVVATLDEQSYEGSAAEDEVARVLGISLADYDATVNFSQADLESLVGLPSGKRRGVVSGWLRLGYWADVQRVGAERLAAARAVVDRERALLDASFSRVLSDDDRAALLASVEADDVFIADARARLDAAAEASAAADRRARWERDVAACEESAAAARKEYGELRDKLRGWKVPDTESEVARLVEARSVMNAARDALALVDGTAEFSGECPVTCSECPVADRVRAQLRDGEERASEARGRVNVALEEHRSLERSVAEMRASERDRQRASDRLSVVAADGKRLALTLAELRAAQPPAAAAQPPAAEIRAEYEAAVKRRAGSALLVEESDRALGDAERHGAALKAATAALAAVQRAVQVVGPSGAPARIARRLVLRLEDAANALLADVGLSVEFAWERPTKDLELSCSGCGASYGPGRRVKVCPACGDPRGPRMADELEILVADGSGELDDVRAASGGTRAVVACAIRLGAAAVLRESTGTPVGWACVDEPFGMLDAEARGALSATFAGMLGSVGLEQAFVVSHDSALLDALPHRVVVMREGNRSRAVVE